MLFYPESPFSINWKESFQDKVYRENFSFLCQTQSYLNIH